MNIKPIVNFARAGLNTDLMPWDLEGDYLTDIRNIRIRDNKLTPFGGYVKKDDVPLGFHCGLLMPAGKLNLWLLAGASSVYSYSPGIFTDLTLSGMTTVDQDKWSGCLLSSIPIIANLQIPPQYCPGIDSNTPMEILPWDATQTWGDVSEYCQVIRSHKQFLFALGIFTGGSFYDEAVRWSAPADTGGVPPTWDELDTTNVAGFVHLSGEGGKIIDGLSLRDAFVVYREKGITIFDYVGGNFVWQIRNLSTTVGCISPNCIAEVNGLHYFIGDGDIYVNDGNTIQSLLYGKIQNRFATSFDLDNFTNSYVVNNKIAKEIWFCIPSPGSIYPDIAFVFNWMENSWTIIDVEESAYANYGTSGDSSGSWDDLTGSWDAMAGTWDNFNTVPFNNTILSVTNPLTSLGAILSLDNNLNGVDTPFYSFLERSGYPIEGIFRTTSINRAYIHSQGDGVFDVELGSQKFPGDAVTWKPPVQFTVGASNKVDVRTTGELHSFRISGTYSSSQWALSGIDLLYMDSGAR